MGRYFDVRKPFRKEDAVIVKTTFSNAPKASQDPVDWGDYTKLTIKQATALSYALSPLKIDDYLDDPNDDPDLLRDIFHARKEVIEQAISCGIIKTAAPDPNSGEICVLTEDVVRFFQGGHQEVPVPPQPPVPALTITTSTDPEPTTKVPMSPSQRTRNDRLTHAIIAAREVLSEQLKRKPRFDEVFDYLRKYDQTDAVIGFEDGKLVWEDQNENRHYISLKALANRLSRRKNPR